MQSTAFFIAAIGYIGLTLFNFFSYPSSWRKHKRFLVPAVLWHIAGLTATMLVFTVYRDIPDAGLRQTVTQVGSCYYITATIQAILFAMRHCSDRALRFVLRQTGRELTEKQQKLFLNGQLHTAVILAVSFGIFTVGYFHADTLQDTRYEVRLDAASAHSGLNICLISDIHAGSGTWENTYDDLIAYIDRSAPDVLLIAGDVFDETTTEADVQQFTRVLREIRQPVYGIWYIRGNHDPADWAEAQMREMGAAVLSDEMVLLGEDIQLIGQADRRPDAEALDSLFADCAPDPDKPILLMTHRPQCFSVMAEHGCDLALTGHSHGFNIPQFLGAPLYGDMFAGRKDYDGMTAVTSSGVSAWGFHYKWPAANEVVTIHVTFSKHCP